MTKCVEWFSRAEQRPGSVRTRYSMEPISATTQIGDFGKKNLPYESSRACRDLTL